MKRGTFKISTNLFRFRDGEIIARVIVRNDNKAILTKAFAIQQSITPEAEVKKSVVYNDPEASTINYYFNLFKAEIKSLVETSTPETIADDIQGLVYTPVFSNFFCLGRKKQHKREKQPKREKNSCWRRGRSRDLDSDVRIVRDFDPYAFSDDFQKRNTAIHFNQNGESLDIKFNYERAVKNGIYKGKNSNYYAQIRPYLPDIESWQQIQDDEEMKKKMEIYSSSAIIDFALYDDKPTEEKEYAPYISRDQWEVMMDDYIQKLKIKWQQEEKQTAEK